MRLARRLEHKAEIDIVSEAVPAFREGLPGVTIAKVIDPVLSNGPSMPGGQTPGMTPYLRRRGVWEPTRQGLMIIQNIQPYQCCLVLRDDEVEFADVRIQVQRRWGIESESASV